MITEVKWKEHQILGNLHLDFKKADGFPYSTIVLAGENGTGKTTILETLCTFLNLGTFEPFDFIRYTVENNDIYIETREEQELVRLGYHLRKNKTTGTTEKVNSNRNNNFSKIESDLYDLRHYGCAYSKARSGFNTKKVTSVTTEQLDNEIYIDDSKDDFTNIKQLLVDIDAQDNSDWMEHSLSGNGMTINEFQASSKLYRFKCAFNNFFEYLQFKKIDTHDKNEKKIIFEKNGTDIDVDSLSTGEKQIVFRGTRLLKNNNSLNGGLILIDEPELSMHPKWQEKVFSFYKSLFVTNGTQTSQIIISTHSEYVLKEALENPDDTLVIVLHNKDGNIESTNVTTPTFLPIITSAEVNYLAFGIISNDYHIQLYSYLQSRENRFAVKALDDYIKSQQAYIPALHRKPSTNPHGTSYETLPTYIRNAIDHPDSGNTFTIEELETSIKLLTSL